MDRGAWRATVHGVAEVRSPCAWRGGAQSNNDHLEMGALGSFKIYFFSLPVTARLLVFTMLAGLVAFKATKMLGRAGGGINWPSQNALMYRTVFWTLWERERVG